MNPGFILVSTENRVIQEESDGREGHIYGEEENQGGYKECEGAISASYICHHTDITHKMALPITRGLYVGGGVLETYAVSFPRVLHLVACPVGGYLARENNPWILIEHFMYRHCKAKVVIIQEGLEPLPRYDHCGIHFPFAQMIKQR